MIELSILTVITALGAFGKNLLNFNNEKESSLIGTWEKYFIPFTILINMMAILLADQEYLLETLIICLLCIIGVEVRKRKSKVTEVEKLVKLNIILLFTMIVLVVLLNIFANL